MRQYPLLKTMATIFNALGYVISILTVIIFSTLLGPFNSMVTAITTLVSGFVTALVLVCIGQFIRLTINVATDIESTARNIQKIADRG